MQGVKVEDVQLPLKAASPLTFCTVKTNQQALEQELDFPIDIDAELEDLDQSISRTIGNSLSLKELMDRIDAHIDTGIKIISHFKGAMNEGTAKSNLERYLGVIQTQKQKIFANNLSRISHETKMSIIQSLSDIASSFESCSYVLISFKEHSQEILAKLRDYFKQIDLFINIVNFSMAFVEEASCSCVLF